MIVFSLSYFYCLLYLSYRRWLVLSLYVLTIEQCCVFLLSLLFVRCGSGLSGECLTDHGHMWIGLDISSSMLGMLLVLTAKLLMWDV